MSGVLGKSVAKKLAGDKPSAVQAALAAVVVAIVAYRLMRG